MSTFGKFATSKNGGTILLIGAGVAAAYLLYHLVKQAGKDLKDTAGQAISGATEVVGGIATGRNSVTADTPYYDTGIVGTIAASENSLLGGAPEAIGDWIGTNIADFSDWITGTDQGASGNPIQTGKSQRYRDAAQDSPVNAQYAATPYVIGY